MQKKILIAYATKMGSTQEIAEKVTATLHESGLEVEIQPARNVRTLEGYGAVVLGAPLYMFHWHKDALNFLTRFRKVFEDGLPIAIFAGGPIGKGDEKDWQEVRNQIDKELERFSWLKPLDVEIVGGRFDPSKLGFPMNLLPAMKQAPATDLRDWNAIRTWANNLATKLQNVLSQ
jgi:menaquinone-dependent protoporphyrinogen oxidase